MLSDNEHYIELLHSILNFEILHDSSEMQVLSLEYARSILACQMIIVISHMDTYLAGKRKKSGTYDRHYGQL